VVVLSLPKKLATYYLKTGYNNVFSYPFHSSFTNISTIWYHISWTDEEMLNAPRINHTTDFRMFDSD
jgi:hypothetical protein